MFQAVHVITILAERRKSGRLGMRRSAGGSHEKKKRVKVMDGQEAGNEEA